MSAPALRPFLAPWRPSSGGRGAWTMLPLGVALAVAVPVAFVAAHLALVPLDTLRHLAATVLPRYLATTGALLAVTLGAAFVFGVGTAWLVTAYEFPGRRLLQWALTLPLALPAYVSAFAYVGLLGHSGTLPVLAAGILGLPRAPAVDMMTLPGAAFVLAGSLYPYVYLTAQAAFAAQSGTVLEVARSLSAGPGRAFWRVALPLARPAIVAGLALTAMEGLSDFGTTSYYGVDTLGVAVLRAWLARGNAAEAAHLAAWLLLLVGGLLALERRLRGGARHALPRSAGAPAPRLRLGGATGALAAAACAIPAAAGFLVPTAQLAAWSLMSRGRFSAALVAPASASLLVAVAATAAVLLLALALAYGRRVAGSPLQAAAVSVATLGYAVPGSVLALGIVIPLGWLDHRLADLVSALSGRTSGLLISGTVAALVAAMVARFLAVAYHPIESGFARLSRGAGEASLSLGRGPLVTLWRIEIPLLRAPVAAAALIVFLEVLKELPLTLILRPFNFHTLATRTFQLAGDERLASAAPTALMMVVLAAPIVYAINRLSRGNS
jgi:iron(III) transport system permease protein